MWQVILIFRKIAGNKFFKIGVSVLLTYFVFAYFFQIVDFEVLKQEVGKINWWWMLASVGAYLVTYLFRAWRIYLIVRREQPVRYGTIYRVSLIHQFYNRILPFKTGELSLVYLLKKNCNLGAGNGSLVLLFIRVFDFLVMFMMFLLCSFMIGIDLIDRKYIYGILAVFVLFLCLLPYLLKFLPKIVKHPKAAELSAFYKRSVTPQVLVKTFVSTLLMWLFLYLSMHLVIAAFSISIPFYVTVCATFLASVGGMLPINGIGGFGAVETGWVLGFTLLGLDKPAAVASSIVSNLESFVIIVLFGAGALLIERIQKNDDI